ncbi:AMP-dependent synthetase [Alkalihalophilus pseudofirmus]|nr:AMP-dependent synthetase [Alkalihalophilus pseudofirmus]
MEKIWMESWPKDIPKELKYRLGEKPLHEYLRENAKMTPNKTAFIFYGKEITWKELNDRSDRLANFFKQNQIEKGDRIGLFMQNCPQYVIAHYAIQKIGAIVTPLNPMYKENELEYHVCEVDIKAIVTAQELLPIVKTVQGRTTSLELIISTNYVDYLPEQPAFPFPSELLQEKADLGNSYDLFSIFNYYDPINYTELIDITQDVALMIFTSGTTGRPKGAMLTYENALNKTAALFHANSGKVDEMRLSIAPLYHIAGMLMGMNVTIYSGATCVLLTRFDAETTITAIEQYKCTTWYSIAPMNVEILNYPGIDSRDIRSLKTNPATSFGIPVTEGLAARWEQITDGCKLYEIAYGLTETHTSDTFMPLDKIKYGSCGIPIYDNDIKIVDLENGKILPQGQQGEIVLKNKGVFKGYWNRPDVTEKTLRNGWVYTGDIGYFDEDGYLYFCGRIKEMIKCSGYSVFPEDVEALILKHPAIEKVAVIGVPDEKRGESVKAFIILKNEFIGRVTEDEIIRWSKENMAAYKYPRYVEFRESLPATGAGKVLRRLLMEDTKSKVK